MYEYGIKLDEDCILYDLGYRNIPFTPFTPDAPSGSDKWSVALYSYRTSDYPAIKSIYANNIGWYQYWGYYGLPESTRKPITLTENLGISFDKVFTSTKKANAYLIDDSVVIATTKRPLLRFKFANDIYYISYVTKSGSSYTLWNKLTTLTGEGLYNDSYNITVNLGGSEASSQYYDLCFAFPHVTMIGNKLYIANNLVFCNRDVNSIHWQVMTAGLMCLTDMMVKYGDVEEGEEEKEDKFPEPSTENGYKGKGDHTSDVIPIPPKPVLSVSNIGLINVYHPTVEGLQGFVNDLFPDIDFPTFSSSGDITEIVENIGKVGESIVKGIRMTMNEKLLDYVLDVHLLPVQPTNSTPENIEVGYTTSSVSAPKVLDDYIDFNCGTVNISECYGTFIDYTCTRCKLYLPFVGYVPINNEYYQDGELSVTYRFNVLDGSFVCFVVSTSSKSELTDSVIGTYSGNCCVHIPISASSFSNVISGVVGGVANMSQAISSGASIPNITAKTLGGVGGAMSQGVGGALQTVSSKPNLMLNNGYNATSSFLGIRSPYLIIERAVPCYPSSYKDNNGFPSYITKKLSECTGYLSCNITNVNIDNGICDDIDRDEIKTLLNDYIII